MPLHPGTLKTILDPQEFAYQTGVSLRGISFTLKPDGWQTIFRGTHRTKGPVYCLYVAVALDESLEGLYHMICNKGGATYWYPDKWAK